MRNTRKKIAILASGAGSNALKLMNHFADNPYGEVVLVGSNRADAGVLELAKENGVDTFYLSRQEFVEGTKVLELLKQAEVDVIVLAGFLLKVPAELIAAYPDRIVNIHPSLLPKFGGKGMYGMNVHKAVMASGDQYSGMTIHLVNEHFDEGQHLFQARVRIDADDTPETLAQKVLELEHRYFAPVVEGLCKLL